MKATKFGMTTQRGKFITIEGQDGAGKSTNVTVVKDWLAEQGIEFKHSREPGGTHFGETIRDLILNSASGQSRVSGFGDKAELLLLFAARAQHIEEVIEPTLAGGNWLLCDRFTDATYAYQGGGRGLSWDDIAQLEQAVQGSLRPNLTILLDLPVELGESRTGVILVGIGHSRIFTFNVHSIQVTMMDCMNHLDGCEARLRVELRTPKLFEFSLRFRVSNGFVVGIDHWNETDI
jgi:dTMP kinase